MRKIVITGGIGYIGTELSKLFTKNNRDRVTVIDNRFIAERVSFLRKNNIEFVEKDLFNCADILKDADVVIHLAGVTDVAYTVTTQDKDKDQAIIKNGIDLTKFVLENISKNCKLIFPSTHVIFEGLKETVFDIDEKFEPCPVLTYAKCKRQNEADIISSGKNYVIMRLSSVYGQNENMRIKILPNLFSKMTSQNQTLRLFGGGVNYKPLVGVYDVARFMYFMVNSNINNEVFNFTSQNFTVKEIAEICKKVSPSCKIELTNDEIPNLGYTLSNKKVLNTGFQFSQNVEQEISNMIASWS